MICIGKPVLTFPDHARARPIAAHDIQLGTKIPAASGSEDRKSDLEIARAT
jgi:hypothetical protein